MSKKILAATAMAIAFAALGAAPASADSVYDHDIYDNIFTTQNTENYVSVFDPAAYGSRSTDALILSPYGASQPIWCFSFHAQGSCWQVTPSGNEHVLEPVVLPTGSSAGSTRGLAIYNPFKLLGQ